jgi:vancomycin resistance protein YoaR
LNKLLKTLAAVAVISAVVAVGIVVYDFIQTRGKFPHPTLIGRVNVSGLTIDEALDRLSSAGTARIYSPLITFEAEKKLFPFTPEQAGLRVNIGESVRRAFATTHSQGYLAELRERLKRETLSHPVVFDLNESRLRALLSSLADEIRSSPRDASIILYEETGGYHIEAEDVGREANIDATVKGLKQKLPLNEKLFPVAITFTYPQITENKLRSFPPVTRLSAYTTYYGRHDSPNRIHNIKLIASWLDGVLLMPGDEFSLANAVGDFTEERGFKEAYVIFEGALVPQLGGGTCQIGTTLYNAIQLADLEVLKRQNHSFYFNIYPLGRDATVYPGQKDLVFRNDTGHPVLIKAVATNRRLSFRIYGTPTGKKVEFSAPRVFILTSSGYRPATVREVLAADSPFKTIVVRKVTDAGGKLLKEETINSSYKLYGEKSNVPIARPEPR